MKNKTYKVGFFQLGEPDRTGKRKKVYLGANHVDVYPWDTLDLQTKAFRQASPRQQIANEIDVKLVRVW